jgi:signal transduction histidine kinase/ActR/RegA family two-component response regulator
MKSSSLRFQLLLAFVLLVVSTTVALTTIAYRTMFQTLEMEARRAARVVAQTRAQMLTQALTGRQLRATRLLLSAESLCSEQTDHGLAWASDCLTPILRDFQVAEHADGVRLSYRNRTLGSFGVRVVREVPTPPALATLVPRPDGRPDYVMLTTQDDLALVVQFSGREVQAFFEDRGGLRRGGEILLAATSGRFLTEPRYWSSAFSVTPPGANVEPLARCVSAPEEVVDIDYRGVATIHALQPVDALSGACVDAHMNYDEALAPAERLRDNLQRLGAWCALLGALLSVIAAHGIAAPVGRLVQAVTSMRQGQFHLPVPVGGPSEVRGLGQAFRAMAGDLAELVGREQAARREAEAASRAKDEFLATVSHELRTPLTAILGWARLLRTGSLDRSRTERAVEAIERSADVQRRLIEDLLDVSRIVANRLRLVLAPVDISGIVDDVLDTVRPQAAEKNVSIDVSVPSQLGVLGDSERLQQVIRNLVWNAVKFSRTNGHVHVSGRRLGGAVELIVTDDGVGIAPEFLPRVFDWFQQADPRNGGSHAGLGLGLGIVQHLVKLHGGSVRASSDGPNRGATFVVTLPFYEAQTNDVPCPRKSIRTAPADLPRLNSVRVLVVDDDDSTREVLRAILEAAGAIVQTAASAAEARRHVETATPDVLISDIAMPEEDGYALLRSLRASSVTVPAIALTALSRRQDVATSRDAGYQIHMIKPADPVSLIVAVANLGPHLSGAGGEASVDTRGPSLH